MLRGDLVHTRPEVRDEVVDYNPRVLREPLLHAGAGVVARRAVLIAAQVQHLVREEPRHLADPLVEEVVGLFARGIEVGLRVAQRVVAGGVSKSLGLGTQQHRPRRRSQRPRVAVSRHVELRHDTDTAMARVVDDALDLLLGVHHRDGVVSGPLAEAWKQLGLDGYDARVGNVPAREKLRSGQERTLRSGRSRRLRRPVNSHQCIVFILAAAMASNWRRMPGTVNQWRALRRRIFEAFSGRHKGSGAALTCPA